MDTARLRAKLLAAKRSGRIVHLTKEEWNYMQDAVGRDPLLVEREKTHGSFAKNAEVYGKLRMALAPMATIPTHTLALDMICMKLSRLAQNPSVKDHWDDIAGYAKLGSEACD